MKLTRSLLFVTLLVSAVYVSSCGNQEGNQNPGAVGAGSGPADIDTLKTGLTYLEQHPGASVVEIRNAKGEVTQVPVSDFEQMFKNAFDKQKKLYKALYVNGDGSISIHMPKFLYAGDQALFFVPNNDMEIKNEGVVTNAGSMNGICKLYGFTRSPMGKTHLIDEVHLCPEAEGCFTMVMLNAGGEAVFSMSSDRILPAMSYRLVQAITCRQ